MCIGISYINSTMSLYIYVHACILYIYAYAIHIGSVRICAIYYMV